VQQQQQAAGLRFEEQQRRAHAEKSERGDQQRVGFVEPQPQPLIRGDAVEQLQREIEDQQPIEVRVHVSSLHGVVRRIHSVITRDRRAEIQRKSMAECMTGAR
jgi:hypothetical protein